jgi:hypothetical protein
MDRARIEKLLRMAHQTVSPREAEVARGKLKAAGEWPPKVEPRQTYGPTGRPPNAFGQSPLWAFMERDLFSPEEVARWRHAKAEFMAGRQQAMNDLFYKDFMEGFGEELANAKKPRFRRSQ